MESLSLSLPNNQHLVQGIQFVKDGIGAFCKCHRAELVKRAHKPIQDVLFAGHPEKMYRVMTLYDAPPATNVSSCFMYEDGRDYFECATIVRMPETDFRVFRVANKSQTWSLCADRRGRAGHRGS